MRGFKSYWIFCGLLLVVYLVAQYTKPTPTNWATTYLPKDKIPFGTYILRQQIKDLFPDAKQQTSRTPVHQTLQEKPTGSSNYLIITGALNTNKDDVAKMISYMSAGNHIFIATYQLDGALADILKLKIGSDFDFQNKTKYPINFTSPHLKREVDYYFEKGIGAQYFSKFDRKKATVLGLKYGEKANYIKYNFGKGALFILPNPQVFTNYNLLNDNNADYASKALSYLPQAKTLIWDEYYTQPPINDESILRVLFNDDNLRWAYYLALFSLLVFVLYEMKRRQRIIPIIDPLKNTSVEFAQVVGSVYYQQRNNSDIVQKKINYLLDYIRIKYRIKTTVIDQEFIESLAKLSGSNLVAITELTEAITSFKPDSKVSDQQLIDINKLIEKFYKQDQ